MEYELNEDPRIYEPKPVFGVLSWRTAAIAAPTAAACVALGSALTGAGAPPDAVALACAAVAVPVGVVGLSSLHGMRAEQWMPLLLRELRSPGELIWAPPRPVLTRAEPPAEPADERRARRRAERAARKEQETDGGLTSIQFAMRQLRADADEAGAGDDERQG